MAKSGVDLHEDVKTTFNVLKQKKTYLYIIFKLSDDKTQIVVDSVGEKEKGASFEDFRKAMEDAEKDKQGRYAIYDLEILEPVQKNKILFICWLSDNELTPKEKMVYSSSKEVITRACEGISHCYNINDISDMNLDYMKTELIHMKKL